MKQQVECVHFIPLSFLYPSYRNMAQNVAVFRVLVCLQFSLELEAASLEVVMICP